MKSFAEKYIFHHTYQLTHKMVLILNMYLITRTDYLIEGV